MAKTFLRWAGSKRQIVKRMAMYWTGGNTRYVEPFAGSALFFFELEPRSALLGDINSELIGMYEVVRSHPRELHQSLNRWANSEVEYYRVRDLDIGTLNKVDRAARFIYLNRFCFNGLYRTNRKGQFNVPYGGGKSGALPLVDDLKVASELLARSKLINGDFSQTLKYVEDGDFVYLDPPFATTERRVFKDYSAVSFGQSDVVRLRRSLEILHETGATFLLSYTDCAEGRMLAQSFRTSKVMVNRHIAGFTSRRRVAVELLITNADT